MNYLTESSLPHRDVAITLYAAVADGDLHTAAALVDPDVVLHVPGTHPLAGTHCGVSAFADFLMQTRALTVDGEQIEVLDVLTGAEYVAMYCRVRAARASGATLDNTTVHLLRIVAGKVTEAWLHNWDDATVDQFWN